MKRIRQPENRPGLRASFTVEAAFVVPMILMVLAMLIQMTLYLTDTVRLEAAMAEYALSEEGEEETPGAEGIFLLGKVGWETEESGNVRKVNGRAQSTSVLFGKKITWEATLTHENRECVSALRRIYALVQAAKSVGG